MTDRVAEVFRGHVFDLRLRLVEINTAHLAEHFRDDGDLPLRLQDLQRIEGNIICGIPFGMHSVLALASGSPRLSDSRWATRFAS